MNHFILLIGRCCLLTMALITFAVILTTGSFGMKSDVNEGEKAFYTYSNNDLSRLLKIIGYPDFPIKEIGDVSRNSAGTSLRFYDWKRKVAIAVCCDCSVERVNLPSSYVWLNDDNQVISWFEEGVVHYKNGMTEKSRFRARFGSDLAGTLFVKDLIPDGVGIFSIERPEVLLMKPNVLGTGILRIFSKGNRVFLFDHTSRDGPLKAHIMRLDGSRLAQSEEITIPKPTKSSEVYYVEDLSPWGDELMLVDVVDWPLLWPFKSQRYKFDLLTHELKHIGAVAGYGFYLQCDILNNIMRMCQ